MQYLVKIIVVLMFLGVGMEMHAQDVKSKKAERQLKKEQAFNELVKMVNDKSIEFEAEWVHPLGFSSINLISNANHLRLRNDSVYMHIPFFGRAYQSTPGERGGFYVDNNMLDKQVEIDKRKKRIRINFKVDSSEDCYQCQLEIMSKESATLGIISNNRSSISYTGHVREWKEEEN